MKGSKASSRKATFLLFAFIVSIPVVSIYTGYMIGMYLKPDTSYLPDHGVVIDTATLNYSWYNTHNLTLTLAGGIGNRMFQYAALYGIAKANGLKPLLSKRFSDFMDVFPNIETKAVTTADWLPGRRYLRFTEMKAMEFDTRAFSLNFMKNIRLEGFWQSWRYFDHVRSDIRNQFRFRDDIYQAAHKFLTDAREDYIPPPDPNKLHTLQDFPVQFVGVHVRRGDYLDQFNVEKGYTTANAKYIQRTMQYFSDKYKNVIFIVTSDDKEWSGYNVKSQTHPVHLSPFQNTQPYHDLCLLSQCNHTVVTVGTFGWWGAWLAGGETLYYRYFPKPKSDIAAEFRASDYFVPQWIAA